MYEKILAPLDGSKVSECILDHVRVVATGCQVPKVVLLRVIKPLPKLAGLSEKSCREADRKAEADATNYLAKLADRLKKEGIAVETAVVHGSPDEKILDYAKKNKVDLIIISSHGSSGVSRWLFGSVAQRVLRHSTVPVLTVVPPGFRSG
jgi:nucleotide-binding universal stress UspA family protein